ncbi:LAETG motif-containing sortase-dependent surface protein [Streptomyces sp. NPDC059176]|uniref:LAETG motif-containing sortase-dependent surface protein n=1 Tax=Streptomyces sp. NPDC059176 TaxID=3346758 RepID=UPI0036AFD362
MKLRRAMAVAAATAVIAPAAFLAAPSAFAADTNGTTSAGASGETATTGETGTTGETSTAGETATTGETTAAGEPDSEPKTDEPATTGGAGAKDTKEPATGSAEADSGKTAEKPAEKDAEKDAEDDWAEPELCETNDLKLSVKGLPGKIAAGSGWHKFTLNVLNDSEATLSEIDYFAGAAFDKEGMELFKSKQVALQAYNEDTKAWDDLSEGGEAVGYVGQSDEVKPGYEVDIPLRINVKANAPVGAGFTLGGGVYIGDKECMGYSDVAYKFQIVAGGTDTDGTEPQEGGKVPVPTTNPASNTSSQLSGNLAETGSSSVLPVIGISGGIAVVAGAGVVFAMRRRKGGAVA